MHCIELTCNSSLNSTPSCQLGLQFKKRRLSDLTAIDNNFRCYICYQKCIREKHLFSSNNGIKVAMSTFQVFRTYIYIFPSPIFTVFLEKGTEHSFIFGPRSRRNIMIYFLRKTHSHCERCKFLALAFDLYQELRGSISFLTVLRPSPIKAPKGEHITDIHAVHDGPIEFLQLQVYKIVLKYIYFRL